MWKTVFVLLLFVWAGKFSNIVGNMQPYVAGGAKIAVESELRLAFCGDLMQHMPQVRAARTGDDYDYMPCFAEVRRLWDGADFVIANLETTLADGGFSGYPCFASPWQLARDAARSGIGVMTTANNHCCDRGLRGVERTIGYLDSLGVAHSGTWRDSASYRALNPLILRKKGFRIALLNYTYDTNGVPVPRGTVASLIDTTQIAADISRARDSLATNIIAFMHWGEEYQREPSAGQRELASWLHRRGVDLVVGSHPHVVQPAEYYVEGGDTLGVTVYSLGNFVSNQREFPRYGGLVASVAIRKPDSPDGRYSYRMRLARTYVSLDYRGHSYVVVPEQQLDSLSAPQKAEFERLLQNVAAGE
jgi:poly-gamma-glutamate synthesis protein (capsule biosynthesis protein)